MDTSLTKDAKGFVDSVVGYLKIDKQAAGQLPKVQSLLSKVSKQAQKEPLAIVETAIVLNEKEKDDLAHMLADMFGHPMTLVEKVNPEVLAGIRIQVADWIVDTTYRKQLQTMSTLLTR